MHFPLRPFGILTGLFLTACPLFGQALPGNEAIVIQGKGSSTTRSFAINDNWHVEVVSDAAVKVDSTSGDGTVTTTLLNFPTSTPAPPTYSGSSAVVAKGGTFTLSINTTGTWQVIVAEGGFTKNLTIGGTPVAAASTVTTATALPASTSAPAITPSPSPITSQHTHHRLIANFNRQTDPRSSSSETTPEFTSDSDWTIRWHSTKGVKITMVSPNGSTVLAEDTSAPSAQTSYANLVANGENPNPHSSYSTNPYAPSQGTLPMSSTGMFFGGCNGSGAGTYHFEVEGPGSWGIMVLGTVVETTTMASVSTPTSGTPQSQSPATTTPAPSNPPAPIPKLSDDQARAVVLIKGDNAEGTGFMIKTPDGPAVVTNIHVIANNPNLKITTNTGALVTVLSEKGASDRDLALLAIKDEGYNYLQFSSDISKDVQPGDEVITPGNSQGGEVMLNTGGKVLGIGPVRIEFDNPIYHGNSGGPVFHPKSGKVLGVVTEAMKIEMTNDLDKASFASRGSAISGSMRYFGLRLDTVDAWIPIDSRRFQIETTFLDQFHEQSRRLDAYINHSDKDRDEAVRLYQGDDKIMKANDNYSERSSGADTAQHIDLVRSLIFDLQCVADLDMDQIKDKTNFYTFDQERAQDEYDYRKALKNELESFANNVDRASFLPRSNSN